LLHRALRGDRQHRIAHRFQCGVQRAFGVGYLLQGIWGCVETVPPENVSVKLLVQCPPLHDGGLVISELLPWTAWALKLRLLTLIVMPEGALGKRLKRISTSPLVVLNRRPTTFSVVPAIGKVPERMTEAMSPLCFGVPRYIVKGTFSVPNPLTLATTFPDPTLLLAGHGFGWFEVTLLDFGLHKTGTDFALD